ncbi:HNH endonuclease [Oceanobacillus kimchii]|uniref:HNH endonuclease signature motif containing protein n=1 Tax=Oceanobacillus kimchii TaxID=746691 RepID=UPI003B01939B
MPAVKGLRVRGKCIEFEVENGCFICISHAKDWDGYPLFKRRGRMQRISRFIYEECYGFIDEGLVVRHKCDNPGCINPEHLETGTHRQNSQDMVLRGRSPKGVHNGSSKLTDEKVIAIRKLKKDYTYRQLSEMFGISIRNTYRIVNKESWKHI